MSAIPEDVLKAAREAVVAVYVDAGFSTTTRRPTQIRAGDYDDTTEVQAAARAILAERERIEAITQDEYDAADASMFGEDDDEVSAWRDGRQHAAQKILSAIRKGA